MQIFLLFLRTMTSLTNNVSYVDVLIVGAGPAGLMSAIALCQAGVRVKIVDQRFDELSSFFHTSLLSTS